MSEVEILEAAIAHIESGRLHDAATLLRQSGHPRAGENADNCARLARSPNPFLQDMLLQLLKGQVQSVRVFRPQTKSSSQPPANRTEPADVPNPPTPSEKKIKFHCTNCGKSISIPVKHAGKKGKCPGCGATVRIPAKATREASALVDPASEVTPPRPAKQGPESRSGWLWKLLLYTPLFVLASGVCLYLGKSLGNMSWFWAVVFALTGPACVLAMIDVIWRFVLIEGNLRRFLRSNPAPDAIIDWLKKYGVPVYGESDAPVGPCLLLYIPLLIAAFHFIPWDPSSIPEHIGRAAAYVFGGMVFLLALVGCLIAFVRPHCEHALRILRVSQESNCKLAMAKWEELRHVQEAKVKAAEEEGKRKTAEAEARKSAAQTRPARVAGYQIAATCEICGGPSYNYYVSASGGSACQDCYERIVVLRERLRGG